MVIFKCRCSVLIKTALNGVNIYILEYLLSYPYLVFLLFLLLLLLLLLFYYFYFLAEIITLTFS
jgi:hypothetical protein